MSTLPGLASKGEKGKSKFQSLDINSLYRSSRGESSEKQQQKNLVPVKHGMQSLGRVPNARRVPVNLPSLKSEHSGSDTPVSLVPSGGPGWGNKDATSTSTTTPSSTTPAPNNSTPNAQNPSAAAQQPSAHQANIALPVTATVMPPKAAAAAATPAAGGADKSWSSVATGADGGAASHPPPYQSPQFRHEFPSLSAGDGGSSATQHADAQYGPGPSLRPQTEGSWTQGGSRGGEGQRGGGSAPLGAPPQLPAQVGQQPLPPQFRGVMPPFMYRNNFAPNGHPPNNTPPPMNNRNRGDARPPSRHVDPDEVAHRPIIKEEDLNRMDDVARDVGWAMHDDIDYNQKLAFSDDESPPEKDSRKEMRRNVSQEKDQDKTEGYAQDGHAGSWGAPRGPTQITRGRSNEEDDVNFQRKRQQYSEDLAIAVERAKQRKEEEEKRFKQTKLAAAEKLRRLDDRISKEKREKELEETQGTINPSSVPPQPITPAPIPVPEWERERDNRSHGSNQSDRDQQEEKMPVNVSDFRQLTQIEGKNFVRKDSRSGDRTSRERDQNGPNYSRHFQADIPPRFQKKLQNNPVPSAQAQMAYQASYDNRWMAANKTSPGNAPREKDEDKRDYGHVAAQKRQNSEEYRRNYADSGRKSADNRYNNEDYRTAEYDYKKEKEEEKWEKDKKQESAFEETAGNADDWHERRDKYREDKERFERPQRPDSRDSRASRDSRHSRESIRESEPREFHDHGSWADAPFEPAYEEKKRDHFREDRGRQVPGPITKDRIEADDFKNEKRGLTQLKRGQMPEKKIGDGKREDAKESDDSCSWNLKKGKENAPEAAAKPWADIPPSNAIPENQKFMEALEKVSKNYNANIDSIKEQPKEETDGKKPEKPSDPAKDRDNKRNPPRNRPENQGGANRSQWGGNASGYVYRSSWSKRNPGRGARGPPRPSSARGGDWVGTDSEGSPDEVSASTEGGRDERGAPRGGRKFEKDEKNREIKSDRPGGGERKENNRRDGYVPRGEPSRHGRGGYNLKRGGLSKRIDGYGPPPSKSPFGHSDEREKKASGDETAGEASTEDKNKFGGPRKDFNSSTRRSDEKLDRNRSRKPSGETRRNKSKGKNSDSNSENSDDGKSNRKGSNRQPMQNRSSSSRRNAPPPRLSGEKRGNYPAKNENVPTRQGSSGSLRSSGSLKKEEKSTEINNVNADLVKNKENIENQENVEGEMEEKDKSVAQADSDGFQEVKSKKNIKERQKSIDEKPVNKNLPIKSEKEPIKPDRKPINKPPNNGNPMLQLTQQQIANIPSLMATPVNPPAVLPQPSNKTQFDRERSRQSKLPPRLAKQKENSRLQKAQMQQGVCDPGDLKAVGIYGVRDGVGAVPMTNAWDKPLTPQLRGVVEQEGVLGMENCKVLEQQAAPSQSNSPGNDKVIGKGGQLPEKAVLDGATPPVNTIIFENTNFKSAPGARNARNEKSRAKLDEELDNAVIPGYGKPVMPEYLNKTEKQEAIQIQLTFNSKEDNADMKLDFFETEISHLTDDKTTKNLSLPRSMQANNTISASTADALNFKIQSVKKVWETSMPTVIEHNVGQDESSSFGASFGPDPNSLDPAGPFSKGTDTPDDNHEGYSPSPSQVASNSTTNVCKVKPTQQVAGTGGQAVLNTANHQQHSGIVGPGLMGHQLSPPPPMQPVIGAGVGLGQPPQPYTANQHMGYQPSLGTSSQYGMSAIPSPPTVLFNSTQQLQAAQTGLYGHFPMDQAGVMGAGQGRSQYSQYPYGLGQTGSGHYSAQSVYLQAAAQQQPQPAGQPPPDLYSGVGSYRLSATGPFGQSQQLSNPTTVLMSSTTSNSLMSAAVKPSGQQISAIGTKAGGVGQAYQQQSQQGQQLYMAYDPSLQANYIPNTGVLQRGPGGPVQNNVVPALQASSSYYSGSTGGQTGYFQQPANSTLQSAQLSQHQAGYGLQGNLFGNPNQSHTSPSPYNSHFLSANMQMAAAAAMNAQQQYRSQSLSTTAYLKGVASQGIGDQTGRPQQLKSPGSQQDVMSSVFNTAPQIPSPKSRQNCKQPPQQPSPTSQHKYNFYQGVSNQQTGQAPRYTTPIHRPVNYSPALSSMQNSNSSNNPKHRSNNAPNKAPTRQYYTPPGSNMPSQNEKTDDVKLVGNSTPSTTNANIVTSTSAATKTSIGSVSPAVNQTQEISKEAIVKEETVTLKD